MRKAQAILCILVIFCIGYYACQKQSSARNTSPGGIKDGNLAEIIGAKRDFFSNLHSMKTTTTESTGVGSTGFNPLKSLEKICRWDRAKIVHLSGRDVVIVPLFFENRLSVQPNIGGNQSRDPINSVFKLVIYKDDAGKSHAEVVSGFKDLNWKQSDF